MKKKYLPIIVLLFILPFAQVCHAVTRQEVENIMQSFISGKERNIPRSTSVSKGKRKKRRRQEEKHDELVITQKKQSIDPYTYVRPEDVIPEVQIPQTNAQKQINRPNIKVIQIPQFGPRVDKNKDVQTEDKLSFSSLIDTEESLIPQSSTPSSQQGKIQSLTEAPLALDDTITDTDISQERLANDPSYYQTRRKRIQTKEKKTKINIIQIPHDGQTEKELLDSVESYTKNNTSDDKSDPFTIKSKLNKKVSPTDKTQESLPPLQFSDNIFDSSSAEQSLFTKRPNQNLTREEVFLTCMTKMGWANTLTLLRQLVVFNEYPNFSPVDFIRTNMKPAPPADLFTPSGDIFPSEDLPKLKEWIGQCIINVQLETKFTVNDNSLYLIKKGVPTQSGKIQDMDAKNVPLFIVYYIQDSQKNAAEIVPAKLFKHDKLPLSIIAREREGVELAINGGYFGAAPGLIIGVLRFKGRNMRKYFWPYRSGIAWNDYGEHRFFDGRFTKTVVDDRAFDKYTEVFQAGPMLIFNGQTTQNTENFEPGLLNRRHPRSFVAEQADGKLVWGLVDGRNASHSVGMTINELRRFCEERHFVNALNLDGGGSSSIWWNGIRFSRPSNQYGAERKIPYAVLIYRGQARPQQDEQLDKLLLEDNKQNKREKPIQNIPKMNKNEQDNFKIKLIPENTPPLKQEKHEISKPHIYDQDKNQQEKIRLIPEKPQQIQNKSNTIVIPPQDTLPNKNRPGLGNTIVIPSQDTQNVPPKQDTQYRRVPQEQKTIEENTQEQNIQRQNNYEPQFKIKTKLKRK